MITTISIFSDQPGKDYSLFGTIPGIERVIIHPSEQEIKENLAETLFFIDTKLHQPETFFERLETYLQTHIFILSCPEKWYKRLPEDLSDRVFAYLGDPYTDDILFRTIEKAVRVGNLCQQIESLRNLLDQKEQELSAFKLSNEVVTDAFRLSTVLETLIEKIKDLIPAQLWLLYLFDTITERIQLEVCFADNVARPAVLNDIFLQNVATSIVHENRIMTVSSKDRGAFSDFQGTCMCTTINNLLGIPIASKENHFGTIVIINKHDDDEFSSREKNLVRAFAEHISIILENSVLYNKTKQLSVIDDLTQIYNFRYLDETLETEIRKSQKYQVPLTMLFIDLNGFKEVNEQFGHIAGNSVLKAVATLLKRSIRRTDVVTRFGGDEFTIILPETTTENSVLVARRIRTNLINHTFAEINANLCITASIGIATFPDHADSKRNLIKSADDAMYRAKDSEGQIAVGIRVAEDHS